MYVQATYQIDGIHSHITLDVCLHKFVGEQK